MIAGNLQPQLNQEDQASPKPANKAAASSAGFTIIELLIATFVFSIVVMLVTTGILQFTRVYFKGITEGNTQAAARNVIDTISQAIQFTGGGLTLTGTGPVINNSRHFCIGDQRFSYKLGSKLSDNPNPLFSESYHVLVVDTLSGCTESTNPQDLNIASLTGRELMSPNMRLSQLKITGAGINLYKIEVRVVHGDDDILTGPTGVSAKCQGVSAGTQFCAVSDLATIVVKRVQ